ncbi:hypothetical protein MHEL_10020 [Mycolicibacterium helvum]|uniref:Uncharacterized protein n=1 Tax=Mycolicibacterium helvum TaxID=1534349 RepID=A0A7I7T2R8_9MYCO|nr:hypothetical protein MHEL_10020 [Mycolicibacterium helvum]
MPWAWLCAVSVVTVSAPGNPRICPASDWASAVRSGTLAEQPTSTASAVNTASSAAIRQLNTAAESTDARQRRGSTRWLLSKRAA